MRLAVVLLPLAMYSGGVAAQVAPPGGGGPLLTVGSVDVLVNEFARICLPFDGQPARQRQAALDSSPPYKTTAYAGKLLRDGVSVSIKAEGRSRCDVAGLLPRVVALQSVVEMLRARAALDAGVDAVLGGGIPIVYWGQHAGTGSGDVYVSATTDPPPSVPTTNIVLTLQNSKALK